jgi:hypothetical protein
MLWVSTVAQTLFVVLWLTQRWWTTRVGRALMAKSAALAVIFMASVWAYYQGPLPVWLGRLIFGAVTLAIVGQFLALAFEVWRARREHRPVSGANGHQP